MGQASSGSGPDRSRRVNVTMTVLPDPAAARHLGRVDDTPSLIGVELAHHASEAAIRPGCQRRAARSHRDNRFRAAREGRPVKVSR